MNGLGFDRALGLTPAFIASVAAISAAHAVEIDDVLGRWSTTEYDECGYADNSEGAPIRIARDEDGTSIGNYGWLCTVKTWSKDGDFLVGSGDCGSEGGDDPFTAGFRIGLNREGQLVMAQGEAESLLRRCPPALDAE
ncbi:MAG: hypothetical protein ACKVP5_18895 [Aestuariivirga sp.]